MSLGSSHVKLGEINRETIFWGGNYLEGNCPGGGQLTFGANILGTIVRRAIMQGAIVLFPF